MVRLSLVCHYLGEMPLCVRFRLGGAKSALGGIDLAGQVKLVRSVLNPVRLVWGVHIGKPARPILELVRPVWR
jgi:hypothetical protein